MTKFMIDIETLGTVPGCTVLAVAAVPFNENTVGNQFFMRLNIHDQRLLGSGSFDSATTRAFWDKQSVEIRHAVFDHEVVDDDKEGAEWRLSDQVNLFARWIESNKDGKNEYWCNGTAFDLPILDGLFARAGVKTPWQYHQARDLRTFLAVAGKAMKDYPNGELHHPVNDCINQVRAWQDVRRMIQLK